MRVTDPAPFGTAASLPLSAWTSEPKTAELPRRGSYPTYPRFLSENDG
jgi:hypothetical protein